MNRADASMELLRHVAGDAYEPSYTAHRGESSHRWRAFAAMGLCGVVVGAGAVLGLDVRDQAERERATLLGEVAQAEQRQAELSERLSELEAEVADWRTAQLGPDASGDVADLQALEGWTGATAVMGPGVRITIADGHQGADARLLDSDLRQVLNGLWAAEAEAIAVNGHRVGPATAVRSAGQAVTVNYRSLVGPYVVEAIGSPATLASGFGASSGGAWLDYLRQNYGLSVTIEQVPRLRLSAVSTSLRSAREEG